MNLGSTSDSARNEYRSGDPGDDECEHVDTYVDEDAHGNEYVACEDCGVEVEQEDTRSFYWDPDTGKVAW